MKVDEASLGISKTNGLEVRMENLKSTSFQTELEKAFDEQDEKKLRDACKELESVFMNMMYKHMRATIPKWDAESDSFARQTFESMLDEEFAAKASEGRGVGLGEMMFEQLSRQMKNAYKSSKF